MQDRLGTKCQSPLQIGQGPTGRLYRPPPAFDPRCSPQKLDAQVTCHVSNLPAFMSAQVPQTPARLQQSRPARPPAPRIHACSGQAGRRRRSLRRGRPSRPLHPRRRCRCGRAHLRQEDRWRWRNGCRGTAEAGGGRQGWPPACAAACAAQGTAPETRPTTAVLAAHMDVGEGFWVQPRGSSSLYRNANAHSICSRVLRAIMLLLWLMGKGEDQRIGFQRIQKEGLSSV